MIDQSLIILALARVYYSDFNKPHFYTIKVHVIKKRPFMMLFVLSLECLINYYKSMKLALLSSGPSFKKNSDEVMF
jgi:hypothetical protein